MFVEIRCPECNSKETEPIGVDQLNCTKWYIFLCKNCEYDWPEEVALPQRKDGLNDLKIDAILLGTEIFEATSDCLCAIGRFQGVKKYGIKRSEENCLESLMDLEFLLSKTEERWGLPRFRKILNEEEANVSWAIKELVIFASGTNGQIQKKAEKIIIYLDNVAKKTP